VQKIKEKPWPTGLSQNTVCRKSRRKNNKTRKENSLEVRGGVNGKGGWAMVEKVSHWRGEGAKLLGPLSGA